jgi:hypothetical protein
LLEEEEEKNVCFFFWRRAFRSDTFWSTDIWSTQHKKTSQLVKLRGHSCVDQTFCRPNVSRHNGFGPKGAGPLFCACWSGRKRGNLWAWGKHALLSHATVSRARFY